MQLKRAIEEWVRSPHFHLRLRLRLRRRLEQVILSGYTLTRQADRVIILASKGKRAEARAGRRGGATFRVGGRPIWSQAVARSAVTRMPIPT